MSLEAKSPSRAPRCVLRVCALLTRLVLAPRAGDLGQPRAGDAAFAGSFITARKSSGVMFVNTAAMCARARGEASNRPGAPGGEVNLGAGINVAKPASANSLAGTFPS